MKKQKEPDYSKQVKVLTKNYRFLEQHYIRLLFEFCEFQAIRTCRILQVLKDIQIPVNFIKKLVEFPNESDNLIKQMENQFFKKYGQMQPEVMNLLYQNQEYQIKKNMNIDQSNLDFFSFVPQDVCASILSYLDPFSFSKISQTNKKFLLLTQSEPLNLYFKNLCMKLFRNQQPSLPNQCRFTQIRTYVHSHPNQYGPNIINAVTNNLRYYVWKSEPQSFKVQNSYYKTFGSYRNLYLQAPRIHFNGVYVCKHKYVRMGERGFVHSMTPMHVVYYYRYIRFFQDGSLLCYVSPNKCRQQQLAKRLSRQSLLNYNQKNQQLKIGEFMQYKNTLYFKIVKCNTVFSYQLQINSNQSKISDELMVINYTLEMVDERQIVQNLYTLKPHKQKILFHYLRNSQIQAQNSNLLQAISL